MVDKKAMPDKEELDEKTMEKDRLIDDFMKDYNS